MSKHVLLEAQMDGDVQATPTPQHLHHFVSNLFDLGSEAERL
jgi:hypothetical protein